jgi:hypothetical protein
MPRARRSIACTFSNLLFDDRSTINSLSNVRLQFYPISNQNVVDVVFFLFNVFVFI